jgi:preprotein translocase subunit YajC
MLFLPVAVLQAQAPAASPMPSWMFLAQMGVIFAIFYFIVMRPQRKQQKLLEQALMNLSKGDEVHTAGGIIGEVVHMGMTVKEGNPVATMGDRITIKSGESRLIVERGRITRVGKPGQG